MVQFVLSVRPVRFQDVGIHELKMCYSWRPQPVRVRASIFMTLKYNLFINETYCDFFSQDSGKYRVYSATHISVYG